MVQIGDLGLSASFTQNDRRDLLKIMRARTFGKDIIFTPEQTTKDWDYLDTAPILLNEPTAGNYDWWTNLYQVAHVMWQLITGLRPVVPPECSREEFTRPDGTSFYAWTYGGLVLDERYGYTDRDLRKIVAQGMAHQPSDRPTMTELEAIILDKISTNWAAAELMPERKTAIRDILDRPPPSTGGLAPPFAPPPNQVAGNAAPPAQGLNPRIAGFRPGGLNPGAAVFRPG
ncbi:hypothetical protein VMCG_04264 [Cytospora schulzeri]|uniref:Protein kinase domain-containing protein n=1 Tax=Cytospora schulzeri TaxID=448051 RepID=A0A423WSR7_9PEZI|nr:hypothetical protein VMCG_04264 [Valsa malicola]